MFCKIISNILLLSYQDISVCEWVLRGLDASFGNVEDQLWQLNVPQMVSADETLAHELIRFWH